MYKRTTIIITITVLAFIMSFPLCFASETTDYSITIEGSHKIIGNESLSSINNVFILESKNNAPLPSDSENNKKEVVIEANKSFEFGKIEFNKPGTYEYKVSRKEMNSNRLVEDKSVYNVKVAIFSDGTNAVIFQKEGEKGKSDKIEYEDTYVCELTFYKNNKSDDSDIEKKYYPYGSVINLPNAPKKEGFTFDYWKGSRYDAGAEYKVVEDHTFNAVYIPNKSKSNDNKKNNDKLDSSNSSNSSFGSTNGSTNNSQTGDYANMKIFIILIGFSLIMIIISIIKRKK